MLGVESGKTYFNIKNHIDWEYVYENDTIQGPGQKTVDGGMKKN
jgi:hypothetical protein